MRVAIDVAQTCVERAGCGYYADSLARALATNPEVGELHLLHQFGDWLNTDTIRGTHIDSGKVRTPFAGLRVHEAAAMWREIGAGRVSFPGNPQLVHSCSFQAPRIPGIPLVYTVYDVSYWVTPEFTTEQNRLVCQWGTLDALERAAGFIFISQHAHDEFERVLGGWLEETGRPWSVIPLAARTMPPHHLLAPQPAANYWLAVGSLEPRKNYVTLLAALEIYWRNSPAPIPLWIAGGRGWRSEELRRQLNAFEQRGMVRYLGYVDDENLANLMAHAQALIFPSWYEGFGLPVVEAMAAGCPVICSQTASLPEAGGDAALYVDPGNHEQIAEAMQNFDANPHLRHEHREAGLRWVEKFSWQNTAAATVAFYTRVLESFRPAR